jgi:hypothetical protein
MGSSIFFLPWPFTQFYLHPPSEQAIYGSDQIVSRPSFKNHTLSAYSSHVIIETL